MPEDIASLGLRINSLEVKMANRELDKLERQSGQTERATTSFTSSAAALAVKLGLVAGAAAGLRKLITVAREFDVINASLVTVTGSSENANAAFARIEEFAKETPFALDQVAKAFIKLTALGMDPSERALESYGNTASAMGFDLNQMVEAVADAATGEFERLKEFGIKAKSQGDKVTFTFRGMATTIGKNAKEIQEYLLNIGETDFAGAMTARAATLDGAISNLGDTWDGVFRTIAQEGTGEIMEGMIRDATSALEGFDDAIKAGTFDFLIKIVHQAALEFGDLGDWIGAVGAIIVSVATLEFEQVGHIIDARKEERAELDRKIDGIWSAKRATDELNKSEKTGIDQKKTAPVASTGLTVKGSGKEMDQFLDDLYKKEDALRQSLQTQIEIENEAFEERKKNLDLFNQYGIETNVTKEDLQKQHEANMLAITEDTAIQWNDIWASAGNRFAAGIGDAVATAVIEQQSMTELMQGVLRGVLHQVISTLVEIGVKQAALAVMGNTALATQTAASVAAAGITASAWATPAAFASLASFGANAVPASAGIASTVGLSESLALAGMAHNGLDNADEGTYLLKKGEMVLDPGTSEKVRNNVTGSGGSTTVVMPINISAVDAKGVDGIIRSRRGMIQNMAVGAVREAMQSNGRRSVV